MNPACFKSLLTAIASLILLTTNAQNNFFTDAPESGFNRSQQRVIVPSRYRTVALNQTALVNFFSTVTPENKVGGRGSSPVIELPMPGGSSARFRIWESSVMDPELAAKFPEIKTFTGQGIDDPTASIKLDWTPRGFHAMVISSLNGT